MKVTPLAVPGPLLIEPRVFHDGRGWFLESWNERRYAEAGIDAHFVQDNISRSKRGVIRGLHYQEPDPQAKLCSVVYGEVWDVIVDVRPGSATRGRWEAVTLSAENAMELHVPEGFAHGFAVLSDVAVFSYRCSRYYNPAAERTIRWDDPELAIPWPVAEPLLSEKDRGQEEESGVRTPDSNPFP